MGVKKHKIKKALFQWVIEHHTVAIVIHSGDPLNSFKLHKIAYVSWGGNFKTNMDHACSSFQFRQLTYKNTTLKLPLKNIKIIIFTL